MFEILKILHFLSFSVAIGAAVSNQVIARRLPGFPPNAMPNIGAIRMVLGKATTHGLILLWITGIIMVSIGASSAYLTNPLFIAKMVAVLILTGISIMANITIARARSTQTPPNADLMRKLGISGLAFAILALILAVLAFT